MYYTKLGGSIISIFEVFKRTIKKTEVIRNITRLPQSSTRLFLTFLNTDKYYCFDTYSFIITNDFRKNSTSVLRLDTETHWLYSLFYGYLLDRDKTTIKISPYSRQYIPFLFLSTIRG
jgi:hypothetical protein